MSSTTSVPLRCGNCNASPADNPSITLQACTRCKDKHYCNKNCQAAAWPFHKANCNRPNYKLKVHLCPGYIKDPEVIRVLSVPANTSFATLHEGLQIAFGWANTHAYDFAVKDPSFVEGGTADYIKRMGKFDANGGEFTEHDPREFMMRISLEEPYRRGFKLDKMHEGKRKHPRCVEKHAKKMKMWQLFDDKEYNDKEIEYLYDFGDSWQHTITVEGRSKASDQIVCMDGSGHGVAEDVGSDPERKKLREAYRTSTPDRDQREKRQWFERMASNADPLGLGNGRENEWSKATINQRLAAAGL